MTSVSHQPVKAGLKFLADLSEPLAYVASKGGGDQTEHLGNFHTCEVEIHDARSELPASDLDREGFLLVAHQSAVADFYDDNALRDIYHAEIIALISATTGARRVEVFDDTRRSASIDIQQERGIREPANIVHNDYTEASGPRRLTDYFADAPAAARRLQRQRFAIINAWRPIGGTVVDKPLALCDASTVQDGDLVPVERRGEKRTGELQVARHSARQRWYYYPRMERDEVLLFKTYDSMQDGRARFTPHSAFKYPHATDGAPHRESLETRCLVFF